MSKHPFSIIVDDKDLEGDTSNLAAQLQDEGSASPAPAAKDEEYLPAKWKGKSDKERAEMYKNLESAYGRQANELGTTRKLADEILQNKRAADLGEAPAPRQPRQVTVSAADLLERPSEVFTRELHAVESTLEDLVDRKLSERDAKTEAATFEDRHPDAAELIQSEEFAKFVSDSPIRKRAVALVQRTGDAETADALLTEFKATAQPKVDPEPEPEARRGSERAREVSFESGSARGSSKGDNSDKPTYRRVDLMKLKATDPDRYSMLGDEILRAYAEGRVK
jgi:hypothetical protein